MQGTLNATTKLRDRTRAWLEDASPELSIVRGGLDNKVEAKGGLEAIIEDRQ